MARAIILLKLFLVAFHYFPHPSIPGGHERHQALILCDGNKLEKRIRVESAQ